VVGNLSVYTMFVAVNSYSLAGSFQWEQGEALGPIIGLEWLSVNRVVGVLPMPLSQWTEWCLRRALSSGLYKRHYTALSRPISHIICFVYTLILAEE